MVWATKRNETKRLSWYSSTSPSVRQPAHAPPRRPPRPLAGQILADRQTCRWVSIQTFRFVLLFQSFSTVFACSSFVLFRFVYVTFYRLVSIWFPWLASTHCWLSAFCEKMFTLMDFWKCQIIWCLEALRTYFRSTVQMFKSIWFCQCFIGYCAISSIAYIFVFFRIQFTFFRYYIT